MAAVSKDKVRKTLVKILQEKYADTYQRRFGKTIRNWNDLAEALIQADATHAYSGKFAMRTKQFKALSKSTVLDRLASPPFALFKKKKHGMHVKCERDGSAKFSPQEKEDALDRELKGLLEHITDSQKVAKLVLLILEISRANIDEIHRALKNGSLPDQINRYSRIFLRIKKEELLDSKCDYFDLHYENGSDRYSLTDYARLLLKRAIDD